MNPSPGHEAPTAAAAAVTDDGQAPSIPLPPLSIIVPTYQEVLNIPHLVERIERVRDTHGLTVELLFVDDDSRDGTEAAVAGLSKDWIRLIVRHEDRGLSPAVVDGLQAARHDVLIVMDADLSHPPEKIPEMVRALHAGADFVIGSRYIAGGSTDAEWGLFRWLNSKLATLLAWPFTRVRDPMAGFFALERATLRRGQGILNPVGYKIGLELMVKCACHRVREIPIHFTDRKLGSSKLTLLEQLRYIQHLRRLYIHRYWTWLHLAQFLVVGASGVLVNLGVLTLLRYLGVAKKAALAGGIVVSLLSNFGLNRRFTFSYAHHVSILHQFFGFMAACSIGVLVNYVTSVLLEPLVRPIQLAALIGIVAGMGFNFLFSRFLVFKFEEPAEPTQPPET